MPSPALPDSFIWKFHWIGLFGGVLVLWLGLMVFLGFNDLSRNPYLTYKKGSCSHRHTVDFGCETPYLSKKGKTCPHDKGCYSMNVQSLLHMERPDGELFDANFTDFGCMRNTGEGAKPLEELKFKVSAKAMNHCLNQLSNETFDCWYNPAASNYFDACAIDLNIKIGAQKKKAIAPNAVATILYQKPVVIYSVFVLVLGGLFAATLLLVPIVMYLQYRKKHQGEDNQMP